MAVTSETNTAQKSTLGEDAGRAAPSVPLALVVATALNGAIGRAGQMPWHMPSELAYFKRVTMGKPIVMGRVTYQSIGRLLPGRLNIIISRQAGFEVAGAVVVSDIDEALKVASEEVKRLVAKGALTSEQAEVAVIGGAHIYEQLIDRVQRIYRTRVHLDIEDADRFFPALTREKWHLVTSEPATARDQVSGADVRLDYEVLERQ